MASLVVAITGASGSLYARSFMKHLLASGHNVYLIITDAGKQVLETELGWQIDYSDPGLVTSQIGRLLGLEEIKGMFKYFPNTEIGAEIASGSKPVDGMVIIPCTMATAANIAAGSSRNLVERAADVTLKERRPLVIVPRETPFSVIHLRNLLTLAELGVTVLPAMPAYYNKPESLEDLANFIAGRVLDQLRIEHNLFKRWEG